MQQKRIVKRISSVFVITLLSLHIKAQCPTSEITCTDITNCYMIYHDNNDWYYYYREPNGSIKNIGGDPPPSASTYVLMRLSTKTRSLSDVERECQKAGANIAMINNNQEYEQLTENILHILNYNQKSTLYMKVESLPMERMYSTCGKITVKDTILNDVSIVSSTCYQDQSVNSILCESNPADVVVCPETTTVTPTVKRTTTSIRTTPSLVTTTLTTSKHSSMSTNIITKVTDELANETTQTDEYIAKSENQPVKQRQDIFSDTIIYILVPALLVVFLFVIGITCFLLSRRRKKRKSAIVGSSSTAGIEVTRGEENIYADEVQLLDQVSVSLNVASETVEVHLESIYANAEHRVPSQNIDSNQKENSHYKVPKEQNVYDYMTYESGGHDERDSRLSQQRDSTTHSEHYSTPRQNVDDCANECIYQEPGPLGGYGLNESDQYNIQKPSANSEDTSIYHEPGPLGKTDESNTILYDTLKINANETDECKDNIYQEPSPVKDCKPSSNDQYDIPTSAKPSECGSRPTGRVHTQHGRTAMKPPVTRFKSLNNIKKNINNKTRQEHVVPSTYDSPVSYKNNSDRKDHKELKQYKSAPVVNSGELYAIPKEANEQEYTSMDKHEQKYVPHDMPTNKYENCCSASTSKEDGIGPLDSQSSNEHYDVPRIANDYDVCEGMETHQEQRTKPNDHLSSTEHYDVPRAPNEYDTCDDNMNKQCQQRVDISNAFYEALGESDNGNQLHKGSDKKKGKGNGKHKTKSSSAVGGYMAYEGELQNDDHYQELDNSAIKTIKFR